MMNDQLQRHYLKQFNQLHALILQRQAFEAAHPFPPYSSYRTDVNFTDVQGNSLLHYAAALGDLPKIRACLKQRISIDLENNLAQQAIHLALENRQLEAARLLFQQGADCTQVSLAHCQGDPQQVTWFKEQIESALNEAFPAARLNYHIPRYSGPFFKPQKPGYKLAALNRAAEMGHIAFLKAVITRHQLGQKEVDCLLPLAAANNQLETVRYLIEEASASDESRGLALIDAVKNRQAATIDYLITRVNINQQDGSKNTALHYAVANHDKNTTDQLLRHGADCHQVNIAGHTILHTAVRAGCSFLPELLHRPEVKVLRDTRSIYGFTPLDLALHTKQDDLIRLLAPTNDVDELRQSSAYGATPMPINQNLILDRMLYRLKLRYRDTRYFNLNGHCNGFSFLKSLYASKEAYYWDTLTLMAGWDGNEDDLQTPFPPDLPQSRFYKNLDEVFEQWTNDVIWFQHSRLGNITSLQQDDRAAQFDLIKGAHQTDNHYIRLYYEPDQNQEYGKPIRYERNEAQLVEIFSYLSRMPVKTHFEYLGGNHAISGHKANHTTLSYYDCNFALKNPSYSDPRQLVRNLVDWFEGFHQQARCTLKLFCFKNELPELNLPDFFVLNGHELPKSREEADLFQQRSSNRFTPLHVAVMIRSLPAIRRLLADNFCDIHACDITGRSAIKMAIDSDFNEAMILFLAQPDINLNGLSGFINAAYRYNHTAIIQAVLSHPKAKNLTGLFINAIQNADRPMIQHLLKLNLNINQPIAYSLPLIEALLNDDPEIVQDLINHGADLFISCGYAKTPLQVAFQRHSPATQVVLQALNDINRPDATGKAAIHHAAESANAIALKKILEAGADVRKTTAKGQTVFDLLDYSNPCYRLLISHYQFDLTRASDQSVLQKLLVKLARNDDAVLYELILRQCSPELIDTLLIQGMPFLHHLIAMRCMAPLAHLVKWGALVDVVAHDGNTPLMALIQADHFPGRDDLMSLFLEYNAAITLKNNQGKTAMDLMQERGDDPIRQLFAEFGLLDEVTPSYWC